MTPFGPYYPATLRPAMRHAERLAEVLTLRERCTPNRSTGAGWLRGRAEELRSLAAAIGKDWHDGALSAEAAALRLTRHLAQVHTGLSRHLGLHWPACCRPDLRKALVSSATRPLMRRR